MLNAAQGLDCAQVREQKTIGETLNEKIERLEKQLNDTKVLRDSLFGTPAFDLIDGTYYY